MLHVDQQQQQDMGETTGMEHDQQVLAPARHHVQVSDLKMLDRQTDPSSRRLRLSEKEPLGGEDDDTLGMMPPTDLEMQGSS